MTDAEPPPPRRRHGLGGADGFDRGEARRGRGNGCGTSPRPLASRGDALEAPELADGSSDAGASPAWGLGEGARLPPPTGFAPFNRPVAPPRISPPGPEALSSSVRFETSIEAYSPATP